MSKELTYDRRNFLISSAKSFVLTELAMIGLANVPPEKIRSAGNLVSRYEPTRSFSEIRQINAGELNVGYADEGPVNGPVVILLHGWPYDIHSFSDVTPFLVAKGYRVI